MESKILVIEAGTNVATHPLTSSPLACFGAHNSPLDWVYTTTPQAHLNNRECYDAAARALGGGFTISYGTWTRDDAEDHDRWAEVVRDECWSYKGLLPYFRQTEKWLAGSLHGTQAKNNAEHGLDGVIHNVTVSGSSEEVSARRACEEGVGEHWCEGYLGFECWFPVEVGRVG